MRPITIKGLTIDMGDRSCGTCSYGDFPGFRTAFPLVDCGKCKGTGKRGNGRCGTCNNPRNDYMSSRTPGKVRDHANGYADGPCGTCNGARVVPATMYDYLTPTAVVEVIARMPIKVHVRPGELSWGEAHLGVFAPGDRSVNSVGSVVDYGRTWGKARTLAAENGTPGALHDALRDMLMTDYLGRDQGGMQAIKFASRDGVIAQGLYFLLARNGYSVITVNRTDEDHAVALRDAGALVAWVDPTDRATADA